MMDQYKNDITQSVSRIFERLIETRKRHTGDNM